MYKFGRERELRIGRIKGKSSVILAFSRSEGQPSTFSRDSMDWMSRARLTMHKFRIARWAAPPNALADRRRT
jgi:hypothetical protein